MCSRKYHSWPKSNPSKTPQAQPTIYSIHNSVKLPQNWNTTSNQQLDSLCLCKIDSTSKRPVITHSIVVQPHFSWKVFVHNHEIGKLSALSSIPTQLDETSINELVNIVNNLHVCPGHPDSKFLEFAESKLCSKSGSITAFVDSFAPVTLNGETFKKTVHTSQCEVLVCGGKCKSCSSYRILRLLHNRWCKRHSDEISSLSSHTNIWYLNTPEKKAKISSLRKRVQNAEREVAKLKEKVHILMQHGQNVDLGLHEDLTAIMQESTSDIHKAFPEGTFRRIFWDQEE